MGEFDNVGPPREERRLRRDSSVRREPRWSCNYNNIAHASKSNPADAVQEQDNT
jgi:hypothetical protein